MTKLEEKAQEFANRLHMSVSHSKSQKAGDRFQGYVEGVRNANQFIDWDKIEVDLIYSGKLKYSPTAIIDFIKEKVEEQLKNLEITQ